MNKLPRLLKKNAVPSHCLSPEKDPEADKSKQKQRKDRAKIVQEILITANISKMDSKNEPDTSREFLKLVPKDEKPPKFPLKRKYSKLIEEQKMVEKDTENALMNHQIATLRSDNEALRKKIRELQQIEVVMDKRIKELDVLLEKERNAFHLKIKKRMKNFLTTDQIAVVMEKKTKSEWTDEEYAKAYSLRQLGKRAYFHVRNTLRYPLPSLTNLQQWASRFLVEEIDFEKDGKIPHLDEKYQHYVVDNDKAIDEKNGNGNAIDVNNGIVDDNNAEGNTIDEKNSNGGTIDGNNDGHPTEKSTDVEMAIKNISFEYDVEINRDNIEVKQENDDDYQGNDSIVDEHYKMSITSDNKGIEDQSIVTEEKG